MIETFTVFSSDKNILVKRSYGTFELSRSDMDVVMSTKTGNIVFDKERVFVFKKMNNIWAVMSARNDSSMFILNTLNIVLGLFNTILGEISHDALLHNFILTHKIVDACICDGIVAEVDETMIYRELNITR